MTEQLSQHPSLNKMVYEAIREKIINGELAHGLRLQEDILVNMLGTSKTPIKLALVKLEQNGLARTIPRRGTYVIELTVEIAREIYSLREMLEGLAARIAAQNFSEKNIEMLRNILSKMLIDLEKASLSSYIKMDEKFHDTILKASRHHLLRESLKPLLDMITMFKFRAALVGGRRKKAYEEHLKISKALEKRDPAGAEKAMRSHIRRVMEDVLKNFEAKSLSQ